VCRAASTRGMILAFGLYEETRLYVNAGNPELLHRSLSTRPGRCGALRASRHAEV
jgi:hypothetical protein